MYQLIILHTDTRPDGPDGHCVQDQQQQQQQNLVRERRLSIYDVVILDGK